METRDKPLIDVERGEAQRNESTPLKSHEIAIRDFTQSRPLEPLAASVGGAPLKSRKDFLVSGLLKVTAGTLLLFGGEALNTQFTAPPAFYAPPQNTTVAEAVGQSVGYALGNTANWNAQYIGGIGIGLGISDLMEVVKPGNMLSAFTTAVVHMVANPKNAFTDPKKTFAEGYNEVRERPKSP